MRPARSPARRPTTTSPSEPGGRRRIPILEADGLGSGEIVDLLARLELVVRIGEIADDLAVSLDRLVLSAQRLLASGDTHQPLFLREDPLGVFGERLVLDER